MSERKLIRENSEILVLGIHKVFDLGHALWVEVEKCVMKNEKDIEGKKRDLRLDGLEIYHDGYACLLTLSAEIQIYACDGKPYVFNVVVGEFPVYRSDNFQSPLYGLARHCYYRIEDLIMSEIQRADFERKKKRESLK